MEGSDRSDDRTFRVNFSSEGVERLRERVKEKLNELIRDYTDDTLVEYVIVLLRNGRRKEEAKKELNVFLEDDSGSFVSWLWDHLSSNLHLYVQSQEPFLDEAANTETALDEQTGRNNSQTEHVSGIFHSDSEDDGEKSMKVSRTRRNREWKGLARDVAEPPPLRSSEIDNVRVEEKTHRVEEKTHLKLGRGKRSYSPRPWVEKKRNRLDEQKPMKREVTSHPSIGASRRLLQFAVRDAVGTVRPPNARPQPTLKRLRSVVSTPTSDSFLEDRSQRTRSVARVLHPAATAIKAAAEAAEDVIKLRCSESVFDRLGHGMDTREATNQLLEIRAPTLEDGECVDLDLMPVESEYVPRSEYSREFEGNLTLLERNTGLASDSESDNDGYVDIGTVRHRDLDGSQIGSSGNKDENSLMVQYSVAQNADEAVRKTWMNNQDPPATPVANTSRKIVNISVNVNTWKPPHYQASREVTEVENRMAVQETDAGTGKPGVRLMKEKSTATLAVDNEMPHADIQREAQKNVPSTPGLYSAVRPSEDADSRTIFVSNVHFAATKDTLSRHFNKFGEVLKVIIVTDAATGQPKGSAYVEFMRKEAAELALSLNGTSFMSRILKVVRRGSAQNETAPMMAWPHMARGSPFAARLARGPFQRGTPNAFRARLPIKSGPRSLQWKRDAPATLTPSTGEGVGNLPNSAAGNNVPSPTARSLTYVRTDTKLEKATIPS
ncbi:RNA binding (RRM/RBD/RNP motifs) family protein [Tasmannia lanceolata]|uniref:RNA binding (RRM/RBD/RNP motifs) family protein n=1 Tax=Tasmannia lanceolata TaxID=3420 RepID=UPI0040649123